MLCRTLVGRKFTGLLRWSRSSLGYIIKAVAGQERELSRLRPLNDARRRCTCCSISGRRRSVCRLCDRVGKSGLCLCPWSAVGLSRTRGLRVGSMSRGLQSRCPYNPFVQSSGQDQPVCSKHIHRPQLSTTVNSHTLSVLTRRSRSSRSFCSPVSCSRSSTACCRCSVSRRCCTT